MCMEPHTRMGICAWGSIHVWASHMHIMGQVICPIPIHVWGTPFVYEMPHMHTG